MLNLLYYLPMQVVGFILWKNNFNKDSLEVIKRKLNKNKFLILALTSIISIFLYGLFLKSLGGELPFVDSTTTCLSIIAMYLSVKRYAEQWIMWIVINTFSIYMWFVNFISEGNDIATLLMWSVYFLNSIFMFIKWFKEAKNV